jgi:hypothetical protein
MQWEPRWEAIYATWKAHRNSALHVGKNRPEEDYREDLIVCSRVAGAINVLLLRLMGYTGEVRWSAFGDDYDQM